MSLVLPSHGAAVAVVVVAWLLAMSRPCKAHTHTITHTHSHTHSPTHPLFCRSAAQNEHFVSAMGKLQVLLQRLAKHKAPGTDAILHGECQLEAKQPVCALVLWVIVSF